MITQLTGLGEAGRRAYGSVLANVSMESKAISKAEKFLKNGPFAV